MKKFIKQKLNESLVRTDFINRLKPYLINGKFLYHYTLTEHLESIMSEGLIPRKEPNSHYPNGAKGIFLTYSESIYKANLPQILSDTLDDYYDNEESYDNKPVVRLMVDVTALDVTKFIWDDDYILNKYNWNKAVKNDDKIIESLEIWGTIAYLGVIPKTNISGYDFNYHA